MKFTIIITSYNKGQYLKACLDSCLNQSEKDYEIVLCDNYSDDNSEEIFSRYKGLIKLIKKKRVSNYAPKNQIDLIGEGLQIAKGELVCLLDGDDYFQINKLKNIGKHFEKNKDLKVLFDLPEVKKNNLFYKFKLKKKIQKNIWPTIINTSSISIKTNFLKQCFQNKLFINYEMMEIDFRINVYSRCIEKNYKIISENLTVYRNVEGSINTSVKKFTKKWWFKRLQAHKFMNYIFNKHNLKYKNIFDYSFTKLLSIIFNLKR